MESYVPGLNRERAISTLSTETDANLALLEICKHVDCDPRETTIDGLSAVVKHYKQEHASVLIQLMQAEEALFWNRVLVGIAFICGFAGAFMAHQ